MTEKKVKVPFEQQTRGGFTLEAFWETWDCLCLCEVCGQNSQLVTHVQFCPKTELIFLFVCVQVVRRRKLSAARIWQPLQLFISCQKGTAIFVIPPPPLCCCSTSRFSCLPFTLVPSDSLYSRFSCLPFTLVPSDSQYSRFFCLPFTLVPSDSQYSRFSCLPFTLVPPDSQYSHFSCLPFTLVPSDSLYSCFSCLPFTLVPSDSLWYQAITV